MATSKTSTSVPKIYRRHRRLCYRKGADISAIAPDQSPNITALLEKNAIQDKSVPALFNQIENVADIGMRVRNRFDILNFQTSYTRIRSSLKKSEEVNK